MGSVEGVDPEADEGDELKFGKRTPSNEIPLTSNLTTNCGSPFDEFSVGMKICL
jgi:hypothetical protein